MKAVGSESSASYSDSEKSFESEHTKKKLKRKKGPMKISELRSKVNQAVSKSDISSPDLLSGKEKNLDQIILGE